MQNTYQEWEHFLDRPAISVDRDAIRCAMTGRRILITGAGGSIGSALARECSQLDIESLILLDVSEKGINDLDCDLTVPRSCIVGDVCDELLLNEIFVAHRPDIVFHAAASKHVPLMEKNPFAAARTNAIGTHKVAALAKEYAAEQFILLSTDKAADPVSIMGATKRIAELVVLANSDKVQMKAARLGNVLGSSGSVVPLFLKQIAARSPITITHPDATRYFITLDEAVSLLLSAVLDPQKTAVLIPQPGEPRRIEQLANFLVSHDQSEDAKHIPIIFTGLRLGDKLHESLISKQESLAADTNGGALKTLSSPALPEVSLTHALTKIAGSVKERDLEKLLHTVCSAVPEYQPSALLTSQAEFAGRGIR